MSKIIIFSLTIIFVFLMSGCSSASKIQAMKPEPNDAAPLVYENLYSYINIPINIKIKDIENKTNTLLTDLIYEDTNIDDDDIEMKVWKQAPIIITNFEGKMKTILPLKVNVKYRYGIKKLGLDLRDIKEFNLNGNVTLLSDAHLTNWIVSTKTKLEDISWNESPTINILGKNIAITYLINPAISIFRSKIEKKIDESIEKSMDFKPNVLDALEKICTPFEMNANYQSWMRISPNELYTTDAKLIKENIALQMGLKCNMQTLVGNKPESRFDRNKIILKPVAQMPNDVAANIVAVSTFEDASSILTKNFAGQVFGSDSKKVTVQKVNIWHKSGKMVIALDVLGSVNGTIYLTGFPQYNAETKEIFFDQLDYAIDTKSRLIQSANWLAQGLILKKIQKTCRYSITANIDEAKKSMLQYLNNYSPMAGVFINGKIENIDFQKIQLTNKGILAFIKINGNVNVNVDGLK